MRRKWLSTVFGIMLALSVWGNSVYASGMEGMEVSAATVEAEESVEASAEEFTEEGIEPGETAEASEEDGSKPEESTEDGGESNEQPDAPAGDNAGEESSVEEPGGGPAEDGSENNDPADASTGDNTGTEGSMEEPGGETSEDGSEPGDIAEDGSEPGDTAEDGSEPEESTEDGSEPGDTAEDGSEPGDTAEDGSEPEESTEDGSEPGDATEDGSEPGDTMPGSDSTEETIENPDESEETDVPAENGTDASGTEESDEEEFISDEETGEVYYASTSDGWSFTVYGSYATITGYTGRNTVLNVPATVRDSSTGKYYAVKEIGYKAFYYSTTITEVTLPDSVTAISDEAFYGCSNLKKVHLGNGVTVIGEGAFEFCSNLKKVHLGNGVTDIERDAFAYSGITGIIFPQSVSALGENVLAGCNNLGAIELYCQVDTIPAGFAQHCSNLRNVAIGAKVTSYNYIYQVDGRNYEAYPFQACGNLKAVYIDGDGNTNGHSVYKGSGMPNGGTVYSLQNPLPPLSKPRLQVVEDAASRGVLMTTDTPGAIIFYSTTGSTMNLETDWVASGNGVDFTYFKGTVYARTYLCGQWSEPATINLAERKPAQPSFAVKGVFGGREVTFNTPQQGGVIYYSTKGSTDITTSSAKAENGQTVLFENFYGSVYAKTYHNGAWSDASRLILKIPVVKDPVITYVGDKVTIRTSTPDAYIYYTTDGSTPSLTNGKRLSGSGGTFTLPSGTVKAIAVRSCFTSSNVVSRKITPVVDASIKVPSFAVKGVIGGRTVTFSTAQKGAVIYYSSTSSTLTTADRKVNNGQSVTFEDFYGTIYARTYYNGKWSNVARLILKIPVVNRPTIRRNGGGYYTISTSTPNCTIYYTTDGSTPSPTNGRRISGSSGKVYIGNYYQIKAIAVRSCFTNSPVYTY